MFSCRIVPVRLLSVLMLCLGNLTLKKNGVDQWKEGLDTQHEHTHCLSQGHTMEKISREANSQLSRWQANLQSPDCANQMILEESQLESCTEST
jgi:hypothetical protein